MGIPIVLCSDDAVYMEDVPLTEDYFAAVLSWDLSLPEIRQIVENSILFSGLSLEEINGLQNILDQQWDAFITEWSERAADMDAA